MGLKGARLAEAEACSEGVRLADEWVRSPTVIEADCSAVISALRSKEGDRTARVGVIQDISAAIALLPHHRFEAVKREANKVAHGLAHHGHVL